MTGLVEVASSFAFTRWVSRSGQSREAFERWQARALQKWLVSALPRASYYGAAPRRLSDLPITDKAALMTEFHRFNISGVTTEQAWTAANAHGRLGRLTVGASTGTSGNRGLFIISETERFRWLGTILAKTIADLMWQRQRVAVVLPQDTSLYDSARRSGLIDLRFFDLTLGPERWRDTIEAFSPTVIVAPPKILRHFAQEKFRLKPIRMFSAAETLDSVDRTVIEAYFGTTLDQIYMATEGLFAVTCRKGRLHLAEDSVFFEFEPAGDNLVTPLVTAFRRQTQIMARYRMNDLLRLSHVRCSCGSPLRAVDEVVGRMDDAFRLSSREGDIILTPDILRNAVLKADRRIDDFRLIQTEPGKIELWLKTKLAADAATAASLALERLLEVRQVSAHVSVIRTEIPLDTHRKLRRVERRLEVQA
ncbi:CoF synthetase [Agrobacterium tumefaciens]|uniref:F390 synthetase-related protein n=1 Tax=Agrobacterium tumefaciens TaxID=358 RepID=UPI001571615C|nr:F390 synthetase-related protein [Agrobacterium tumefaciens]NTE54446.1 CoF synthetase [Agrobacterium tumefaciens]NTE73294.1 CoF synthetase [Agrobacterium tumefaciens]